MFHQTKINEHHNCCGLISNNWEICSKSPTNAKTCNSCFGSKNCKMKFHQAKLKKITKASKDCYLLYLLFPLLYFLNLDNFKKWNVYFSFLSLIKVSLILESEAIHTSSSYSEDSVGWRDKVLESIDKFSSFLFSLFVGIVVLICLAGLLLKTLQ